MKKSMTLYMYICIAVTINYSHCTKSGDLILQGFFFVILCLHLCVCKLKRGKPNECIFVLKVLFYVTVKRKKLVSERSLPLCYLSHRRSRGARALAGGVWETRGSGNAAALVLCRLRFPGETLSVWRPFIKKTSCIFHRRHLPQLSQPTCCLFALTLLKHSHATL